MARCSAGRMTGLLANSISCRQERSSNSRKRRHGGVWMNCPRSEFYLVLECFVSRCRGTWNREKYKCGTVAICWRDTCQEGPGGYGDTESLGPNHDLDGSRLANERPGHGPCLFVINASIAISPTFSQRDERQQMASVQNVTTDKRSVVGAAG